MQKDKSIKKLFSRSNLLPVIFIVFFYTVFIFGQLLRVPLSGGFVVNYIDVGVVFFALISLFSFVKNKQKLPYLARPLLFFSFIAAFSLLLQIQQLEPGQLFESLSYLVRFVSFVLLYFLLVSLQKDQKSWILSSFIFIGTSVVVLGFIQFFYYSSLRNLWYLGWDDHLYRMFSVFLDPNFAGVIFVLFFIFLLSRIFQKGKNIPAMKFQILHIAMVIIITIAIFLTYSRSALLMLLVSSFVFFLMKKMYKPLFLFLAVFLLFFLVSSDLKIEGLNPLRSVSSKARLDSARNAFVIFKKNPVLGVGFNSYRFAQHRYGIRVGGAWETSHADSGTDNSFLFVLATTGIIGFGLYLYLFWKIFHSPLKEEVKPLVYASIVGVMTSAFFLNTLFYPFVMLWIFSLLGVTESTSQ